MVPLISIVICTKNRFADFKTTLVSLLQQTRLPEELIVVDSSDTSVIRDYLKASHISIKYHYFHTAPGLTYQRNFGVKKCRGALIFFFDDDVVLNPTYIEQVEKIFAKDLRKEIGAVGGRITNLHPVSKITFLYRLKHQVFNVLRDFFMQSNLGTGLFRYSGMPTHPHSSGTSRFIECLSGCCMAFRREVFDRVRFDEKLPGYGALEDAEVSKQVLKAGYKIYYEASALLEHKVSPHDRLNDNRLAEMTVLNFAYLFEKHFPQTLLHRLAFYWTVLGLFLLYIPGSTGWRGVIRGVRHLLRERHPAAHS